MTSLPKTFDSETLYSYFSSNLEVAASCWPQWSDYIPHEPTAKQLAFLMLPQLECFYGGAAGGGKVLYNEGMILTPFGWKHGEDLRVGDAINNPDGSVARIIQLHPERTLQVWRVHFHDGTFTDVAREHLWLAWRSGKVSKKKNSRVFGEESAQVIETQELKKWVDSARSQQRRGQRPNWPMIPLCKPQAFNAARRYSIEIDSYLLGLWLGDGHTNKKENACGITSADTTHLRRFLRSIKANWSEYKKPSTRVVQFLFRGEFRGHFLEMLVRAKLNGTNSATKFIPDELKYGTPSERLSLLQGLLDSDGYVDKRGQVYYCSISSRLASDIVFLIQSLGGTGTVYTKQGRYKKDGKHIQTRTAYNVYLKHPDERSLFTLPRKRRRCKSEGLLYRRVVSVQKLSKRKRGRCITVSHPNGLYITNDFIVTHNSDAILMAALQYVDLPNYAALILRRTFADLALPGALIDRSQAWLSGTPSRWDSQQHRWVFPSGSILQFGYIGEANAETRYQGAEFQFIGFDELAQHEEFNYRYMFSRLRRLACPIHKLNEDGSPIYVRDCQQCDLASRIPLRMRCTSNPPKMGDPANDGWVKRRFRIQKVNGRYIGTHPKRPYIPAFMTDNPYIDQKGYAAVLRQLDPVTREQLLSGDWGVSQEGRFRKQWARYYSRNGEYVILGPDKHGKPYHRRQCRCFVTVDPAGSVREGPGDKDVYRNKMPAWTVISTWLLTPDFNLLWWDMSRFQKEVPDIFPALKATYRKHQPEFLAIECNGFNLAIYQTAERLGLPIAPLNPRSLDKLVRATDAMVRMEAGKIWFPDNSPRWLEPCENEIYTWVGHPKEASDIVDTLAYAAIYVSSVAAMSEDSLGSDQLPSVLPS